MATPRQFGQELDQNVRRRPNMTVYERDKAIGMLRGGCTVSEVTTHFQRGDQTIRDLKRKYNSTTTTQDKPRSGRPPMLSLHQKKIIYRKIRGKPKTTYKELAEVGTRVNVDGTFEKTPSRSTLYRYLKRRGITKYRCKKRPKLNRGHALKRLQFCKEYRNFQWSRRTLKFSDECSVEKGSGQNNEWCFRFEWET
jgi:transposase